MSSAPDQAPEPTPDELRIAELLDRFQELRAANPSAGIGLLREEAGDLFPELVEVAETMSALEVRLGDDTESVPVGFGGFRILERIATGGVGVVYRAENPATGGVVALKVMRQSLALGGKAMERFWREISLATRLDHPNIVPIIAHGEAEGRLYLVMEYVDGCSLAGVIGRIRAECGPIPDEGWLRILDEAGVPPLAGPAPAAVSYARRIASLFVPVADAMAAACEAGLVHRDMKPANLLLRSDGHLMVADFGVAKVEGDDITSTMAVLGTPLFMSPEQAAGDSGRVDARTDVYGLGATIFATLTLSHPAAGSTLQETLASIVQKRPEPITKTAGDYPSGLARLVARCLEKEPRDRYPDLAALRDDLALVADGRAPKTARPPAARRLRRLVTLTRLAAAAALLVACAAVTTFLWLGSRPANLEIRTFPGGEIALNGVRRGPSPWSGEIESGEYELTVTREGFATHGETVRLDAGQKVSLERPLRPLDPFDRAALRLIMESHGIESPLPAEPTRMRGGEPGPDAAWNETITALSPRGAISREGLVLRLRATRPVLGARLEIQDVESRSGFPPIATDIGADGVERPLPEELTALLETGREYVAVLTVPGEAGRLRWTFAVTDARGAAARLAARPARERDEPHVRVFAAIGLIETGQFAEGFAVAERLAREHPDRRLPSRLALTALDGLGLADSPVYARLLREFDAARD